MSSSPLSTSAEIQVPELRRPVRVIGIDLGTTNSAVAEIHVTPEATDPPVARCLDVEQPTRMGPQFHSLVPSVLALHEEKLYVGAGAKDLRALAVDLDLELYRNIFWDCKNDMGVRRTYHRAQAGYRSAKDIGGHLLRFLMNAASEDNSPPSDATVVTVPASFQAAQRRDTIDAAKFAGIDLADGALLDEPVAAFVDYAFTHGEDILAGMSAPRRLVVFDFGGGTCDVAIFELRPPVAGDVAGIGVAPLAVSRYHRLGGGDIDRKIVVEILIPQLVEQNELKSHDLDYRVKSACVIPALLGCAESLKVGLCRETARLRSFGRYKEERATLVQTNPGLYQCTLPNDKILNLESPKLSAVEFEKLLEPFLDRDLLHPRETDYFMTCSVFAPLQDALERAHLEAQDIDLCLPVGGGALIPQVAEAVEGLFNAAKMLRFDDAEQIQTAVANGAAWQALSLAVHGKGLVRSVTGSSISIQSASGPVELIGDGAELPYPANEDWAETKRLVVPKTSLVDELPLRVELRGADDRLLMSQVGAIKAPAYQGDSLRLRYRMDVNQILHLRLDRGEGEDMEEVIGLEVENPLTSVVNPNAKRDQVLELEEQMRTEALSGERKRETVMRIAQLEVELGRYERALSLLAGLNRIAPDVWVLNRMGMVAGKLCDYEREEKFYREAARISSDWSGPLFNLALSQKRQGKLKDAMDTVDDAIKLQSRPTSMVLKAQLAEKLEQPKRERVALLEKAFALFGPPATLSDFQLGWYVAGARMSGDDARVQAALDETRKRAESPNDPRVGVLPEDTGQQQ